MRKVERWTRDSWSPKGGEFITLARFLSFPCNHAIMPHASDAQSPISSVSSCRLEAGKTASCAANARRPSSALLLYSESYKILEYLSVSGTQPVRLLLSPFAVNLQ